MLVVASVISAGFYLPVIMAMYMKRPISAEAHDATEIVGPTRWVVVVATVVLLVFGVWPNRVLDAAQSSTEGMLPPPSRVLTD